MPPTPNPGNGSGLTGWFRVPASFLPMGWGSIVFWKAPLPSTFLELGYLMDLVSCSIVEFLLVIGHLFVDSLRFFYINNHVSCV